MKKSTFAALSVILPLLLTPVVLTSCGGGTSMPGEPTGGTGTTDPTNGGTSTTTTGGVSNPTGGTSTTTTAGGTCTTKDTWTNYAQGFFATNCATCHAAGKSQGTTFFDATSYASVSGAAASISAQINGGTMPPTGAVDSADKTRILAWLGCSTPPN